VSRSGWCQADQKLANTARPVYERLIELIRQCSVVYADETGWRIGTLSAWLWVFTNLEITVYAIRANRSSDVVIDILGREFKGILTSDGFLAYDEQRLSAWLKQKCLSHLLTDLKEMRERKTGRALHFARQMTVLVARGDTVEGGEAEFGSLHLCSAGSSPGSSIGSVDCASAQVD